MVNETPRIRIGDRVTIYQRGKKRIWIADFWSNGRHCRQSLKTANKKIAIQRAQRLEVELASGTYEQPLPEVAITQAIQDYLCALKTADRAWKTQVKYRGILTAFQEYLAKQRVTWLRQFTITHFDQFRAERKQDRHAKSLYCEGVVVKQFLKWCTSRNLIRENPIAEFKLAKPPLVPKAGPNLKQIDSILAGSDGQSMIMLAVLAFTGMRSGELQRLRKEDVDLAGNWIHVVSRSGLETKTRRSRAVPIHARLRALLIKLHQAPGPWLFAADASRKFPDGGHWIDTGKLNDGFKGLLKRQGLKVGRDDGFTIHSLRHSFETICVNAGIPQRVIDVWLGHASDKSMAAVYYRLSDEESQAFMKKVPFEAAKPAADAGKEEE